ncbi:MAG: hypothetical protein GY759_19650 [Chloroflexi bacterium]|nr:hypothetical protein [Chloroflexota bacterium]
MPIWLFYLQPAGHPAYLFPLLGLAGLWGCWQLWRRRLWDALILLIGWAGALYLFLAGIPYQNFRFGLVISMPVILLAGFGISQLWQSRSVAVRVLVGILAVISLVGMVLWSYRLIDPFLRVQNHSKVIAREVESELATEATLLAFGLTLTLQHYTDLDVRELFYLDPAALQEQVDEGSTF